MRFQKHSPSKPLQTSALPRIYHDTFRSRTDDGHLLHSYRIIPNVFEFSRLYFLSLTHVVLHSFSAHQFNDALVCRPDYTGVIATHASARLHGCDREAGQNIMHITCFTSQVPLHLRLQELTDRSSRARRQTSTRGLTQGVCVKSNLGFVPA